MTLKMGSESPKLNQLFGSSQRSGKIPLINSRNMVDKNCHTYADVRDCTDTNTFDVSCGMFSNVMSLVLRESEKSV